MDIRFFHILSIFTIQIKNKNENTANHRNCRKTRFETIEANFPRTFQMLLESCVANCILWGTAGEERK